MPKEPLQQLAYFLDKLRRLKNYIEFSEKNWEEKLASYNLSLVDDDLNLKSFGGERGHWSDLANEFPQYQRKACFLIIFSMLEDDLNQFCEAIRVELHLEISVFDSAGRGIERAKTYVSKVAGIEFPKQSAEWERIQRFRDLRNVLAHEAGYLDEEKAQHRRVKKFSEQNDSGLSVEHYARDRINMEPEFLPSALVTLQKFYELLIEAIKTLKK
jgi:hypothetical protein